MYLGEGSPEKSGTLRVADNIRPRGDAWVEGAKNWNCNWDEDGLVASGTHGNIFLNPIYRVTVKGKGNLDRP